MTRIITGIAGGRRLHTPPGDGTRPTSDRVREALFSRLEYLDAVDEAVVLDLYAGSGALGLEALSRGAAAATFVESDRKAADVIRANVATLGLDGARIEQVSVRRFLAGAPSQVAHLVFLDPPYDVGNEEVSAVLAGLVEGGWLCEDAVLVVERASRSPEPTWPPGVQLLGPRAYGETTVWLAEYTPDGEIA